jgi:hypothetical protein
LRTEKWHFFEKPPPIRAIRPKFFAQKSQINDFLAQKTSTTKPPIEDRHK